jgi:hypothetical protein
MSKPTRTNLALLILSWAVAFTLLVAFRHQPGSPR